MRALQESLLSAKELTREHFDRLAPELERWKNRNWFYHSNLEQEIRQLVPPRRRVLEIGCATGDLLAAVEPAYGVGVDLSPKMIELARKKYPGMRFILGDAETLEWDDAEEFDVILMVHLTGHVDDLHAVFQRVRKVSAPHTHVIVVTYNFLYEIPLRMAEGLRLKTPHRYQNWAPIHLLRQLLDLADFEIIDERYSLIIPKHIPLLSSLLNGLARAFRPLRHFCITQILVARCTGAVAETEDLSCTVVVPTRNERDNIEPCVTRIPEMGRHTEILFVDGNSTDGTWEEIERMVAKYKDEKDIKVMLQLPCEEAEKDAAVTASQHTGKMLPQGKGHAVRLGFEAAEGDVLMILDADLTVPPENLPLFFEVIARGKAELANGSRLVYPMADNAMRLPNLIANKFFSLLFSWLLEQYVGDTLCGTKALRAQHYLQVAACRSHFGDFDPFGDFDLLLGAAKSGLKIIDVPVHYGFRTAGQPKIMNLKHGPMLFRMSWIGFVKLKLPRWKQKLKLSWLGPAKPTGVRR